MMLPSVAFMQRCWFDRDVENGGVVQCVKSKLI
jgi:hypothetical protein